MKFLIVTGMSGGGKTQVTHMLEDLGYYCVDNMPPTLIEPFAEICQNSKSGIEKAAIVVDIRGGELFPEITESLLKLDEKQFPYQIVFIDAANETLIKRYKESRRKHPLAKSGRSIDGIRRERKMLDDLKNRADYLIETSDMPLRRLKTKILRTFGEQSEEQHFEINVVSFGFKFGIPADCDLVFDVRFLPNPFYEEKLRDKTGLDQPVYQYVMKKKETQVFFMKLVDMVSFLIPQYVEEGRPNLVIGIGCTGGHHRSVTLARALADKLDQTKYNIVVSHRDIEH